MNLLRTGLIALVILFVTFTSNANIPITPSSTIESEMGVDTWTERMTVVQSFGYNYPAYKILLRDSKGREYFVWYTYSLNVNVGSKVIVTMHKGCSACDLYFKVLSNPRNGKESSIHKWLRA